MACCGVHCCLADSACIFAVIYWCLLQSADIYCYLLLFAPMHYYLLIFSGICFYLLLLAAIGCTPLLFAAVCNYSLQDAVICCNLLLFATIWAPNVLKIHLKRTPKSTQNGPKAGQNGVLARGMFFNYFCIDFGPILGPILDPL